MILSIIAICLSITSLFFSALSIKLHRINQDLWKSHFRVQHHIDLEKRVGL